MQLCVLQCFTAGHKHLLLAKQHTANVPHGAPPILATESGKHFLLRIVFYNIVCYIILHSTMQLQNVLMRERLFVCAPDEPESRVKACWISS